MFLIENINLEFDLIAMIENKKTKKVSIIIVSYNVRDFLCLCLDSVMRACHNFDSEIFVVDNNSADDSCQMVKKYFPEVFLIENKDNRGFSKANNQAVELSSGEFIHFLNPDTVIPEDFYKKSIEFMEKNPDIGSLGPRIIDGTGRFAPDSKKSFPSFWVSVFKVTGLAKVFKDSKKFNKYYAAHIGEWEKAEVDILSGCCLLVRTNSMMASGGSFDESYFMYCEDVDLCHRLKLHHFKNYYYPEVTIIHYKGESTRKLSFKYLETFYNALAIFVKKYYPRRLGIAYLSSIKVVLFLRNFFAFFRYIFSLFQLFILDVIVLVIVTLGIKNFWFENIAFIKDNTSAFEKTIPVFIVVWLASLFLNGAYDKPFSLFRAGRGMIFGTLFVLALYSLFPIAYRYSRGVVLFSGMTNTVALLLLRVVLANLNWIPLVPRGKIKFKTGVVGEKEDFEKSLAIIHQNNPSVSIMGHISTGPLTESNDTALGNDRDIVYIQQLFELNEIIFLSTSLRYKRLMKLMEACSRRSFFQIKCPQSNALIGDHYGNHQMMAISTFQRYEIARPSAGRNKRILDIFTSLFFVFTYPFLFFFVNNPNGFKKNIKDVLFGRKTWVGYGNIAEDLPPLKGSVVPPYKIQKSFRPNIYNQRELADLYALQYSTIDDFKFLFVNFRYLGN